MIYIYQINDIVILGFYKDSIFKKLAYVKFRENKPLQKFRIYSSLIVRDVEAQSSLRLSNIYFLTFRLL